MDKITLFVAVASLVVGILAISMTYPQFFQIPQLEIVGFDYDKYEHSMDFAISNVGEGVAYVNKIKLEVKNFKIPDKCTGKGVAYLKLIRESIEPIEIKMKSEVYNLENIITYNEEFEIEKTYPISEGLVFGKGEVDGFYLPYHILKDNQYYYEDFSFDAKLKVYWCDYKNCDEQVKESELIHVEYLTFCPDKKD